MKIIIAYDRFLQSGEDLENEVIKRIVKVFQTKGWPLEVQNVFFNSDNTIEIGVPGQPGLLGQGMIALGEELAPIVNSSVGYGEMGDTNPDPNQSTLRERMRSFML